MDLARVVDELGLAEQAEVLKAEWERSQASMPEGEVFFLDPGYAAEACREIHLQDEIAQAAAAVCPRIAGSAALKALAWHFHHCLYRFSGPPYANDAWDTVHSWPALKEQLGDEAGMFYLTVLLSGLPQMKAVHESHHVPPDVVRATVDDVGLWLEKERELGAYSGWGLTPHNLAWLLNHFRGILYRLVRLQFQFGAFWGKLHAFRHQESGVVLALSEEGVRYDGEGQVIRRDDGTSEEAWTASLTIAGEDAVGYPILPEGRALNREVRLPASEWKRVLAPGDATLNLHIPAGSPMSHAECGESFRRALEFFPKHFPERQYAAFCCGSWLLNGELEKFLPPNSNMVRFQRECYLFPIGMGPDSVFYRVFDGVPEDLTKAPRDTALRRAILDYALSGKKFKPTAGGCFLFPEDLDWGAQVYLRQDLSRWVG